MFGFQIERYIKSKKNKNSMFKAQYVFYIIGIIFLFATLAYFSYEYLFNLSDIAKTIVLICLIKFE